MYENVKLPDGYTEREGYKLFIDYLVSKNEPVPEPEESYLLSLGYDRAKKVGLISEYKTMMKQTRLVRFMTGCDIS